MARDELEGADGDRVLVSTVFTVDDYDFGRTGTPLLYETMILGGPRHGYQERYHTCLAALAGHDQALMHAREHMPPKLT